MFAEDSLESIADKALARETGARGLRSILEETLLDVQFELPSRRDVKKCVVTKETIEKGLKPTLVTEAAKDEDDDEAGSRVRASRLAARRPRPTSSQRRMKRLPPTRRRSFPNVDLDAELGVDEAAARW